MDEIKTPMIDKYFEAKLKKVQRARTTKGRLKAALEYTHFVDGVNCLWELEK